MPHHSFLHGLAHLALALHSIRFNRFLRVSDRYFESSHPHSCVFKTIAIHPKHVQMHPCSRGLFWSFFYFFRFLSFFHRLLSPLRSSPCMTRAIHRISPTMPQKHPFRCPNWWVTRLPIFIHSCFIRLLASSTFFFTLVVVSMSCMHNIFSYPTSSCNPPWIAEQLLPVDVMVNRASRKNNMFKRVISTTRRLHGLPWKQWIL
jgi:hypothetical protein